jgi:hypothetical protein
VLVPEGVIEALPVAFIEDLAALAPDVAAAAPVEETDGTLTVTPTDLQISTLICPSSVSTLLVRASSDKALGSTHTGQVILAASRRRALEERALDGRETSGALALGVCETAAGALDGGGEAGKLLNVS